MDQPEAKADPSLRIGVLASGGLDSCVMLAELAAGFTEVHPLYIRCGLVWEEMEIQFLSKFLSCLDLPVVRPPTMLSFPTADVYGEAWYAGGREIPGYFEPDERWEIPGRNLILLAKAALWAKLNGVGNLALGILSSNPFPDAVPSFFRSYQKALSQGLDHPLRIRTPLGALSKAEVIVRGRHLPLEWTLSCADPQQGLHCGACGKCRERVTAFQEAGVPDPTRYAQPTGTV